MVPRLVGAGVLHRAAHRGAVGALPHAAALGLQGPQPRQSSFRAIYVGATARLTPERASEFAAYFAALPAEPASDGNSALVEAGRVLYEQGAAQSEVAACIVCHGPNAQGFEAIPRLGGLSYGYLKGRLAQWSEGYHASAFPMPQVATRLSPEEVEALASYLSFLR